MTKSPARRKSPKVEDQFKILEKEFQHCVLECFKYDSNVRIWRRNVGAIQTDDKRYIKFGVAGMSDLEGIIKEHMCPKCCRVSYGVHIEIELKGTGGKLSAHQKNWLEDTQRFNGLALVLYPEKNDPIGLRERIVKLINEIKCPKCYEEENE